MTDVRQQPASDAFPSAAPLDLERITLPYSQTGYFSALISDYLNGDPDLLSLAAFAPDLNGMEQAMQALDKQPYDRALLAAELRHQYRDLQDQPMVLRNMEALAHTAQAVVTAHQLNLFGGPLYLVYKTITAIALARRLEREFPDRRMVPVFWLGSEDHDFAEINHFRLFGRVLRWDHPDGGSTGTFDLEGLDQVYAEWEALLGQGPHADTLRALFRQAYLQQDTLADAQRRFLHGLFGPYGLVVIDGDTPAFKRQFAPIMAQELRTRFSAQAAAASLATLEKGWHVQAPPRPLNLFYRGHKNHNRGQTGDQYHGQNRSRRRIRLDWEGERVLLADTGESWTQDEALQKLEQEPECFSPNVILRPLHQQKVLPAAVFVGGGAEVAYWLELKPVFEAADVFMPVVLLRNSVLWLDEAAASRLDALGLTPNALFQDEESLVKSWVHTRESSTLSLDEERQQAEALFEGLVEKVRGVDASLVGKTEADKAALLSALEKLEQRLVKAAKQRHEVELNQLRKLHARLFPDRGLQERHDNFSALWLRHGQAFFDALLDHLDPLDPSFTVLVERP